MALSGIQIYKLLPQTNCKDCGFPTCLAFAMKLAAKQAELAACPHVSEESKAQLEESAAPPVRLVTLKANGYEAKAGNETVMYRHEKTFYNQPGIFIRLYDDLPTEELRARAEEVAAYEVDYVGIELTVDGFAIEATGDGAQFAEAIKTVLDAAHRPLILIATDPQVMAEGLEAAAGTAPLVYAATPENWPAFAELAQQHKAPLALRASSMSTLAELTPKIQEAGVPDIVLDHGVRDMASSLALQTQLRRLALKNNFRPLGFPTITFPGECTEDPAMATIAATQAICKYAGFVVLEEFSPATVYPLLVLRQNIYTDPQKPIQVQPGIYELNDPGPDAPALVTTNFSITYFSVANEIDSAGIPAWLLVADAEGMSVLTAWAAGKFDAERIAKDVKQFGLADKINHKSIVLPGHVAVLSGELEEELPGWEILVGPREAVDLPAYLKVRATA
jgi:acetyl-CoA decarbonylase/synthase complex subunit gamma